MTECAFPRDLKFGLTFGNQSIQFNIYHIDREKSQKFPKGCRKLYDKSQCSLMRKTLTNIKIDTNFLKLIKNDYKILTNKKYLMGKIL